MQQPKYNFQQTKTIIMKKILVMATVLILAGTTATMAQTKKPMKHKMDSTMSKDTSMMNKKMKPMKHKMSKPAKDSMM